MKHLLAISWAMPPLQFPRAIQVSRTLKYLAALGWQSMVLCVNPGSLNRAVTLDASLEELYGHHFNRVNVNSPEQSFTFRALARLFPGLAGQAWVAPARRTARKLFKTRDFSAIISFAQPWSDHLIGLQLRRLTGKPWLAHFSDPWIDSPYIQGTEKQRRAWRDQEEAVIREADAVIFVNSQTAELVMQKYPPAWQQKVHVIPHGYDADILSRIPVPPRKRGAKLRLLYTGSFYHHRTPEGLLTAMHSLTQTQPLADLLEVVLIGQNVETYQAKAVQMGLGDLIRTSGPISFTESLQAASEADVLLVIDAPSQSPNLFLPSKLVDYLVFHKPILGLTPERGATADLLRRLECPVAPPDDAARIAAIISEMLRSWQTGTLRVSPAFARVATEYDIRHTVRQLDRILEEILDH
jgi:glycosyltransferase involved in cell wall biosynthesis